MKTSRRKFSTEFKTKVVLEAVSERLSTTELAQKHEIHSNQIAQWKREFIDHAADVFSHSGKQEQPRQSDEKAEQLYRKIVSLQIENDFLKKN